MDECLVFPGILWRIENYQSVDKKVSPAVFVKGLEWKLTFSQFMKEGRKKIRLILECLSSSETPPLHRFDAETSIISHPKECGLRQEALYSLKEKEWCIWEEFLCEIMKNKYCLKHIDILVKIKYVGDVARVLEGDEASFDSPSMKSLTEDLEKLFYNGESSDFVLKCGEKSFPVHKAVLSVRSEFFAGMFRNDMKEVNDGIAKIEDLEPEVLELVLRYMYTGKIPELFEESLHKVYAAADRFAVKSLKFMCHEDLSKHFVSISSEENYDNDKGETLKIKQTDVLKTEPYESYKNTLLEELFMTREWKIFSKEFPWKSRKICKSLLKK